MFNGAAGWRQTRGLCKVWRWSSVLWHRQWLQPAASSWGHTLFSFFFQLLICSPLINFPATDNVTGFNETLCEGLHPNTQAKKQVYLKWSQFLSGTHPHFPCFYCAGGVGWVGCCLPLVALICVTFLRLFLILQVLVLTCSISTLTPQADNHCYLFSDLRLDIQIHHTWTHHALSSPSSKGLKSFLNGKASNGEA